MGLKTREQQSTNMGLKTTMFVLEHNHMIKFIKPVGHSLAPLLTFRNSSAETQQSQGPIQSVALRLLLCDRADTHSSPIQSAAFTKPNSCYTSLTQAWRGQHWIMGPFKGQTSKTDRKNKKGLQHGWRNKDLKRTLLDKVINTALSESIRAIMVIKSFQSPLHEVKCMLSWVKVWWLNWQSIKLWLFFTDEILCCVISVFWSISCCRRKFLPSRLHTSL